MSKKVWFILVIGLVVVASLSYGFLSGTETQPVKSETKSQQKQQELFDAPDFALKDLDGNTLKVTYQAVVDNLASIANHKMGEASESKPIAIVRDSGAKLTDRKIKPKEVAISHEQCVYVRGLKNI